MMNSVEQSRIHTYNQYLIKSPALAGGMQAQEVFKDAVIQHVLAPSLNGYVQWVIKQAQEKRLQRLYFLARDGYLMYKIAQEYCTQLQLSVECRYLYCSRYSIRVPTYHLDIEEAIDYMCRNGIYVSRNSILDRMGILDGDLKQILEMLNWQKESLHEEIPRNQLSKINQQLKSNKKFVEYIVVNSKKQYHSLQSYFKQEGLYDEVPYGIVDSGWTGTTQRILSKILKEGNRQTELLGFYWGLYEVPNDMDPDTYHTYYFSPYKEIRKKAHFSNCLFESIYSAPHGMTLAYTSDGKGKYVPCLEEVRISQKEYMEHTEAIILTYTRWVLAHNKSHCFCTIETDKKIIEAILSLFMSKPIKEEVEAFGTIPFCDDVLDRETQEIACVMSYEEIKNNRIHYKLLGKLGYGSMKIRESAWIEGSIVQCGTNTSYDLWQQYMYKCLLYMKQALVKEIKNE